MNASPVIQAGSERPAQEEVQVRLDEAASQEAHSEDRHEVERDDHVVERARVDPQQGGSLPRLSCVEAQDRRSARTVI